MFLLLVLIIRERMNKNKFIIILFYIFPVFLFIQLAYGLVLREPYPSFIMPGFSRIETNANEYTLFDTKIEIQSDSGLKIIELQDLSPYYSKIAISMAIDIAFFNEDITKNYNSSQKKYYEVIKKIVGEEAYEKNINQVRNPKMSEENTALFTSWILDKVKAQSSESNSLIRIKKYKIVKDFKSGVLIEETVINEYELK